VDNALQFVTEVDYSHPYYYNYKSPIFGTSTGKVELNSDLLSTKSEVTVDATKTAEAIASLIPIKEVLSAALLPTPASVASIAAIVPSTRASGGEISLTVEQPSRSNSPHGRTAPTVEQKEGLYTSSQKHTAAPSAATPLSFAPANAYFTRKPWPEPEKKVEKKDDKNTVSFEGSVKLAKDGAPGVPETKKN
jgi:hypothetical protein